MSKRAKTIAAAAVLAISASVLPLAVATPASAAVSCSYSENMSQSFTQASTGSRYVGFEYAGHYSGITVVPSKTQDTSSGEEAQCLLKLGAQYYNMPGWDPGTVDGVFGPRSQTAFHNFQVSMNSWFNAGLAVGGNQDLPGPNAWKWLRWYIAPDSYIE
ncbi:peptidoglycan-binding domain-containing protein [Streptomyces sp. NPDC054956]